MRHDIGNKYIATSCEMTLHEDDWVTGEGDLISRWDASGEIDRASTVKGILEQVPHLDCNFKPVDVLKEFENDPCYDGDTSRFDADLMVDVKDEQIIKVTPEKWTAFQKNECKLYALHIVIYIRKLENLNVDDIPWKSS